MRSRGVTPGSPGSTVKITLLKAGAEVGTIITSTSIGSSGTGSYTWPISSTGLTGSDFKVKVQSISQPGITDTSNSYFTITPAGTVTPTITVTSPNGGQSWQRGTSHAVTWSYTGSPGSTVKITLLKAGVEVGTIITSTSIGSSGTGSYTWPISSTGLTGSDFKVKVQSISQPGITDTSNSYFTITPAGTVTPTITVTSPNGGESWKAGTPHTVMWTQTGLSGTNVKIDLYRDRVFYRSINPSIASTAGSYLWTIPTDIPAGSTYEVWITSLTSPGVRDWTDGWLTITTAPKITVISPNGDQTWQKGTSHTITWSQTDLSGTNVKILLMKSYGFNVAATIADPVSATSGSFTWTVPSTIVSGNDYWVKIVSLSYPDIQGDMWSGWITIS